MHIGRGWGWGAVPTNLEGGGVFAAGPYNLLFITGPKKILFCNRTVLQSKCVKNVS